MRIKSVLFKANVVTTINITTIDYEFVLHHYTIVLQMHYNFSYIVSLHFFLNKYKCALTFQTATQQTLSLTQLYHFLFFSIYFIQFHSSITNSNQRTKFIHISTISNQIRNYFC